ncbi:MAG: sigma-70 family RNA polymerase sigma factor [Bacteroidota bacterium]
MRKLKLEGQYSDDDLVARLRSSKTRHKAYTELLDRYQERIYWQVRRIVGGHEDATDVTQNVWLKVFRGIDGFRHGSTLYSWLYRIAHNEAINHNKKNKKHILATSQLRTTPSQEDGPSSERIEKLIQGALLALPDRQRMVFEARYFDETPYLHLSKELRISVGALKASYHHAVKKVEFYVRKHAE